MIKAVHGKRHATTPDIPSSKSLQKIVSSVLSSVSETLEAPVCMTEVELNLQSQLLRTNEVITLLIIMADTLKVCRRQRRIGLRTS